ncbi:MAG: cupredoxin domain-containing protein [Candidatus Cohnella colombiensis]|uniref:Cupredoxin domain-containing protein n=1 Tax=Candidatus Cohnella colombiensis TaxID=3121368 RepID=A0AA95F1I3_9BACL|nr:MAG: cupredoxin domain-containing protein [Cohnella sp.]
MNKIILLDRKKIQFYTILAVVVILAGAYIGWQQSKPTLAPTSDNTQVFYLVTGEFSAKSDSGKMIESYRWDPGTIVVQKDRPVELRITGINGQSHPFVIEGLDLAGQVQKGKTTIVRFTPKEAGIYTMVCTTHADPKNGPPMIGYIIVQ